MTLDTNALIGALKHVADRRFLGPVDGIDCVELVFEDGPPDSLNLVTIRDDGRVSLGGVAEPEGYAERAR